MKTILKFSAFAFIITLLLASCSTNKVVQESLIQKRKYRNGFFVSNFKKADKTNPVITQKKGDFEGLMSTETFKSPEVTSKSKLAHRRIEKKPLISKVATSINQSNSATTTLMSEKERNYTNMKVPFTSKIRAKKELKNKLSPLSGRSQIVALILCFFVGALGIHRFYLGYTGIGILMLLTLGLCGILVLIDFIRIIVGDLQPIDGPYEETL